MSKIMIVEDDASLREIYSIRLTAEGYKVVTAEDGEAGLALAAAEQPDLILADVMMPKISGFDMLDILRTTEGMKMPKVIMMTALSSEDQRARGEGLGADRYLVKSQVGIEDVVATVHEVLGDHGAAAGVPTVPDVAPREMPETVATEVATSPAGVPGSAAAAGPVVAAGSAAVPNAMPNMNMAPGTAPISGVAGAPGVPGAAQ